MCCEENNIFIGLDYDDTFTRDPVGWAEFVKMMLARGHEVMIVTWRTPEEAVEVGHDMNYWKLPVPVYATSRKAKMKYMFEQGICIDVVIDDNPNSWTTSMQPQSAGLWN